MTTGRQFRARSLPVHDKIFFSLAAEMIFVAAKALVIVIDEVMPLDAFVEIEKFGAVIPAITSHGDSSTHRASREEHTEARESSGA